MPYGTLSVADLLASTQQSVIEFGEDRVFQAINDALDYHNQLVQEKVSALAEMSTDRQRRYGGPGAMEMDEVDEYGTADAQKVSAGATVGFPMRLYEITVQWTRKYFENHTPSELAAQFTAAQDADQRRIDREIKRALFRPTNVTFTDRLVDNVEIAVKALVNADGADIPLGPNGDLVFDGGTHTHYMTATALDTAAMDALINNVIEHHADGECKVYINQAQEATVRGLTGFLAYLDPRVTAADNERRVNGSLNVMLPFNRAIGVYGAAEIWVKPWVPANYLFAYVQGSPRPLVIRTRRPGAGLAVAAEDEQHPLRARTLEREFGVAVWTRTNGAVMQITAGAYQEPVFG